MCPSRSTLIALVLTLSTAWGVVRPVGAADAVDFDGRVAPVLIRRCLDCHSGAEPKGGLDLSRREAAMRGGDSGEAIAPGKPDESLLWEYVGDGTMPPKGKGTLSADEKGVLRDWIAAGAGWGTDPIDGYRFTTERRAGRDWWSLQPVTRPTPPALAVASSDRAWCRNSIDAFVLGRLEAAGLTPAPPAERRTLIRRLAFDLLGLPPTPEEVERFVADDRADAYERLVDKYLASPEYGVRWGRLWLDLARYGESNGFEHDEFRPDAWRYRDWVVGALNRDLPYDEFARLQLAGDVLRPGDPEAIEATGFLVAGAYDSVGQKQQSEAMRRVVRQDEIEDVISNVSQTFLGLTVHCARCHDHKFDPIRQVEYYRMAAALAGVRHGVRDVAPLEPDVRATRQRITELTARVSAIEEPVRSRRCAEAPPIPLPLPIARWDFDRDERDHLGGLHALLEGESRPVRDGLKFTVRPGSVAATTTALAQDLKSRTLEVWVRLDELTPQGGVIMGVQTLDGATLDAISFSKKTDDHGRRLVHAALVHDEDGTVTAYRDGVPHGTPTKPAGPTTIAAGRAQVVFGVGPGLPGLPTWLDGVILRARLYDRALTPAEVAASAASERNAAVPDAALAPEQSAERARLRAEIDRLWTSIDARVRRVYAVTPRPADVIHRLTRGNPAQPAEVVSAGGLSAVTVAMANAGVDASFDPAGDASEGLRRARLAAWITDQSNPLFARVIVNRLWQGHFGAGLVETASDFGFQGGRPSHPELLDWLASSLIEHGWSLKQIQRQIVTSATYRQSSRLDPAAARIDAANRLLWRKTPLRLEAEAVRDAMLAVAGALGEGEGQGQALGGPGFREFAISNVQGNTTYRYTPVEAIGPEFDRRTLYRTWARGARSGFLDVFDCPDPSTTAPRRPVTTTPLQALVLLNNALTLRLADRLGDRLRREAGDDPGCQVERAYRLCLGRLPDAAERDQARRVVTTYGPAVLARALFNSNEFLYID
jgi:hypothetical protein